MSDQTPDQSDPYADLRRTLPPMRPRPTAPTRPSATGHSSPSGRLHHYGPAIECPNPICAFLAAANPDTVARLLAERDMLAEDGALHLGDIERLAAERDALVADRSDLVAMVRALRSQVECEEPGPLIVAAADLLLDQLGELEPRRRPPSEERP